MKRQIRDRKKIWTAHTGRYELYTMELFSKMCHWIAIQVTSAFNTKLGHLKISRHCYKNNLAFCVKRVDCLTIRQQLLSIKSSTPQAIKSFWNEEKDVKDKKVFQLLHKCSVRIFCFETDRKRTTRAKNIPTPN